jgi:hypothetical protein
MSADGTPVELRTEQPLHVEVAADRHPAPAFDVQARA